MFTFIINSIALQKIFIMPLAETSISIPFNQSKKQISHRPCCKISTFHWCFVSFSPTVSDPASTERLWHHTDRQQWLPGLSPRCQTQQAGLSPLPRQAGLQHRGHPGWWKVTLPRGKFFFFHVHVHQILSNAFGWFPFISFLILTFCNFLLLMSLFFLSIVYWFFV